MKIALMSDLHLEYEIGSVREAAPLNHPCRIERGDCLVLGPLLDFLRTAAPDVVVLAGDIDNGMRAVSYAKMLRDYVRSEVVFVPGNHEYYGSVLDKSRDQYRLGDIPADGIHLLDNSSVNLNGWTFIGSTLWAGLSLLGEFRRSEISNYLRRALSDYEFIQRSEGERFQPEDTLALFRASFDYLESAMAELSGSRTIVVTHHAPHISSIPEKHRSRKAAAAYATDLTDFISQHRPCLWLHGHVHHKSDYVVGTTRVLCNPRGRFPHGLVSGFDPCAAIVEV